MRLAGFVGIYKAVLSTVFIIIIIIIILLIPFCHFHLPLNFSTIIREIETEIKPRPSGRLRALMTQGRQVGRHAGLDLGGKERRVWFYSSKEFIWPIYSGCALKEDSEIRPVN